MNKKGAHGAASVVFSFFFHRHSDAGSSAASASTVKTWNSGSGKKKAAVIVQTAVPCVHSPVCPRLACTVLNVRSGGEQHGVQTTATQRHQQQPAGSADISTSCVRRKPLDERDDVIVNWHGRLRLR